MRSAALILLALFWLTPLLVNAQDYTAAIGKESHLHPNISADKIIDTAAFKGIIDTSSIEPVAELSINESKPLNESPVKKTITKKGIATWLENPTSENKQNLYALHRFLPIGTIITLRNPMNGRTVEVRVTGKLPDQQQYENTVILVSAAAAHRLHVLDKRFIVHLILPVSSE